MIQLKWPTVMAAIFLGGCASSGSEFTCGQIPEVKCQPVSSSYEASNGSLEDYDYREEFNNDSAGQAAPTLKKTDKTNDGVIKVEVGNVSTSLSHAVSGDPIYSEPVVLRILFNDWKDQDGNLHSRNYIYHVVKESQWLIVD